MLNEIYTLHLSSTSVTSLFHNNYIDELYIDGHESKPANCIFFL